MKSNYDVIIIGGGQAGLVMGYALQKRAIEGFLILDANAEIGGSWQQYWDSVTLFSSAQYSSLDGLPFPADDGYYPTRGDMIAYLRRYADHFALPVLGASRVHTIERTPLGFAVYTDDGRYYQARAVISASGAFTKPHIPRLDGQSDFKGEQIHSYHYQRPARFQGQRIVVIGSNNSAVQIGYELAQVADVSLAVRKKIQFTPTHKWGKDIFFFLHRTGFDMLPLGCHFNLCDSNAVYDDGQYQQAVEAGNPDSRPMFTRITRDGVIWADGTAERVDTLLYATGFCRNNKHYLTSLDALDDCGFPLEHKGVSTTVDGLFYIGLEGQIAPASATVRGVSRDAHYIADKVITYL
ncbi:MAG: flavin-containing monooxygenase [Anaerolineae bacterium]